MYMLLHGFSLHPLAFGAIFRFSSDVMQNLESQ